MKRAYLRARELWSRFNPRDKISFTLEFFGIMAVLGYTTVAAFQYCEMKQANGIANKAFLNSDRPWVGFIIVDGNVDDFEVGKSPKITLALENYGKSPGFNVQGRDLMIVSPAKMPGSARAALFTLGRQETPLGTIWPAEQKRTTVTLLDGPLTQPVIDQINNRTLILAVAGDLRYQDRTLHNWHRTCLEGVYEPSIKAMMTRPCIDSGINPDN